MKRTLLVAALVLAISISVIAGTMAMYVVEINELAEGSVVAKEFVLVEGETNTFAQDVQIAPGETVAWEFSVKNHDDGVVSETGMDLAFEISLDAAADKDAIEPLMVTVKDEGEETVGTKTGTGTIKFNDAFAVSEQGQEKAYTVSVEWPWDGENDIDYAGADYGTAITVSVTGTQQQPEQNDE